MLDAESMTQCCHCIKHCNKLLNIPSLNPTNKGTVDWCADTGENDFNCQKHCDARLLVRIAWESDAWVLNWRINAKLVRLPK